MHHPKRKRSTGAVFLLLIIIFCGQFSCSSLQKGQQTQQHTTLTLCSWNLKNFGHTKDAQEMAFIAQTIASKDIIAIQEVVGKRGGADAVIRLAQTLDSLCKPCHWDYAISLLTSG